MNANRLSLLLNCVRLAINEQKGQKLEVASSRTARLAVAYGMRYVPPVNLEEITLVLSKLKDVVTES